MLESAMSHISKPVDWEVYSIPPIQPVQYYSILKKQREFSQLVKHYDAQVFTHSYVHFCGIVPKYFNSLKNRYEIFIIFLDESSSTSFMGFHIKVSKETFTYESKSILLFLKNCEKAISYSMNNNLIHVHCETTAWELFYLLYNEYLKRYVLTIIGTQFFYHFVYSCYIQKEKQVLKWFYKGSRVIRVSKRSVFYKIYRKRKVSVSDLTYMSENMPKRKKYTLSWFNSEEPLLRSNMETRDFYTVSGNKINISKLMLLMYRKEIPALDKDYIRRKKFADDVCRRMFKQPHVEKRIKIGRSYFIKKKWKQFKKCKSYSIKNYSSIPFINTLVPSLLKNEKSSCDVSLHNMGLKTHSHINLPFSVSSNSIEEKLKKSMIFHEMCALKDHTKKDIDENHDKKISLFKSESMMYSGAVSSKCVFSHQSTSSITDHKSLLCINKSDLIKSCDNHSTYFSTSIKDINDDFTTEDVNFTTAAGKLINVSSAAMLKAYKLCEKEQLLSEKVTSTVKPEVPKKENYPNSERKSVSTIPKTSESKNLQTFSLIKNDENISKKSVTDHYTAGLETDIIHVTEDVSFSTAAGKTIPVSNTAIEAAKKLIYSVADEEKTLLHNESIPLQRNKFYRNEVSNIGCTTKLDDIDMDNTLVEKFFEDVHFDEKELELTGNNIMKHNLNANLESKSDSLPTRKLRKSLGGRRSRRDCSNKL